MKYPLKLDKLLGHIINAEYSYYKNKRTQRSALVFQ